MEQNILERDYQQLPATNPRVETGVTRFGDDWPGIFIRGDDALGKATMLRQALPWLDPGTPGFKIVNDTAVFLEQCRVDP